MNYINRLLFILFCVTSTMSFAEKATVSFAEFTKGKIAQQGYFSFCFFEGQLLNQNNIQLENSQTAVKS